MATLDDDIWDEEQDQANQAFTVEYQRTHHDRHRDHNNRSFQDSRGRDALEFEISSHEIGRLIGPGGSKIKELQRKSGTSIKVDQSGYEAVVRIFGNPQAQSQAKQLIDEVLNKHSTKNSPISAARDNEPFNWDEVRERMRRIEEERIARFKAQEPVVRDFYIEHPEVTRMTPAEVGRIREENNNIIVSALKEGDTRPIPNPVTSFEHVFEKYPDILSELKKNGFTKPTPIQCQAWPIIMKGYDLVGVAQTGTGKTIAFLLPALIHIENQVVPKHKRKGPSCLVLAPTRELALQIFEESKKYKYRGIRSTFIYGGKSRSEQSSQIEAGVEIVIATPGRLMDFISDGTLDLISVTYVVLDEADRMLDLGFEKDLRVIFTHIRPDRQTIMTSATWPLKVQDIADKYMDNPFRVNVSSLDIVAAHTVDQRFMFIDDDEEKKQILFDFIQQMEEEDKLLVFVERKALVDDISSDIVLRLKMECSAIQSDYAQSDREQAVDDFKTGFSRILVATNVASRGLDVKDVTHVFNMSMPRDIEDYVHRIGRTGRAGKFGTSITLISHYDCRKVPELIRILEEAQQNVPQELYRMAERFKRYQQNDRGRPRGRGRRQY